MYLRYRGHKYYSEELVYRDADLESERDGPDIPERPLTGLCVLHSVSDMQIDESVCTITWLFDEDPYQS